MTSIDAIADDAVPLFSRDAAAMRIVGDVDPRDATRVAEQVKLLYKGTFAIPANLACTIVVAAVIWDSFPSELLLAWVGLTAAVVFIRLELSRRYRRASNANAEAPHWARLFVLGALSSGLLWGAICAGLPIYGTSRDYLTFAVVAAGTSAGALTSLGAYLPAFLSYALVFVLPLSLACVATFEREFVGSGVLMMVYAAIISAAAHNFSRSVRQTLDLKIANAELNVSLQSATKAAAAAKYDKWGAFAQLSHELRTPLNAILGFSEVMRDEHFGAHGNPRYRDYAADIHSSGRYLLTLVRDLLDLSQGETGMLALSESDCDVAWLVADCVRSMTPLAAKRGLRLLQSAETPLPLLRADETKVRQILLNLVSNAIKFTPAGKVSLAAVLESDRTIALTVGDSGIGMSEADIPLAMKPFVRLANELTEPRDGVGLGLALCKRLSELHGAEFTIDSTPGVGTTCRVRFPPSRTCATTSTFPAPVARAAGL